MPPLEKMLEMEEDLSSRFVQQCADEILNGRQQAPAPSSEKMVKFSDKDHSIEIIPHYSDFSEDECARIWYNQDEFARIRLDISDTILLMKHHPHLIDEYRLTACGLECRARKAVEKRHQLKYHAYSAVFQEQSNQRKAGERHEAILSLLYSQYATKAQAEALTVAKQLESELAAATTETQDDMFDDSWISDLASNSHEMSESSESSSSSSYERSSMEPTFDDDEGFGLFDDSWIMDVANTPTF